MPDVHTLADASRWLETLSAAVHKQLTSSASSPLCRIAPLQDTRCSFIVTDAGRFVDFFHSAVILKKTSHLISVSAYLSFAKQLKDY